MKKDATSAIAFSTMESISVLMGGIDTVTLTRTAEKKCVQLAVGQERSDAQRQETRIVSEGKGTPDSGGA